MYAISGTIFRAINSADDLNPGEQIVQELPPEFLRNAEKAMARARIVAVLASTNYVFAPDSDSTATEKSAVLAYRAALRALPDHPSFPDMPWPTPPATTGVGSETGEQA